jgi:tetratricopeptide (TPR) repeat protein
MGLGHRAVCGVLLTSPALALVCSGCASISTEPPDSKAAEMMSLTEAKRIIQRAHRWTWADGASDHSAGSCQFTPTRIVCHTYDANGTARRWPGDPYESYEPRLFPTGVVSWGIHKGWPCRGVYTSPNLNSPTTFGWCFAPEQAPSVAAALLRWKLSTPNERKAWKEQEKSDFDTVAASFHAADPKPPLPEDARRFKVVAEVAVREKRFADAAHAYEDGLLRAPWSPELHYNAGLMLGEIRYYDEAVEELNKYLALAPDSPDARAVQDRIYQWEAQLQPEP